MIVKSIQSILSKNKNNQSVVIIKGILEKKSDANVTWAGRFCVMSGKDFRYYYKEEDFNERFSNPLGIIPLKAIYNIMPLNEGEKGNKPYAFQICSSSWQKKNSDMEERKFYFAALNIDLLEEWTIYIEFTRAKAIYDEFVNNFGKIQFPLGDYEDHINVSLGYEISNFGKNVKIGGKY
jgi:adenylate cyclase 10